jgi:hypothetical protein
MLEPVMIVSAFGRGLWLAESLLKMDIPVHWVDVSAQLGERDQVEIEGPFPLVQTAELLESQRETWGGEVTSVPFSGVKLKRGICFLTKDGPLEMGSSQLSQRMHSLGLIAENSEYLDGNLKPGAQGSLKKQFLNKELVEVWISQWAHRFWSLQDLTPVESVREGSMLPLKADAWVRKPTGHQTRLLSLKLNPLFVLQDSAQVEDIAFKDRKTPSGLLLKTERSQLTPCSQLIWGLSSSETKHLSESLALRIFKSREKEPSQLWMRWQVELGLLDAPDYFVLLQDCELPWSHSNMLILQREKEDSALFSVWMLIPALQRFNRGYLTEETKSLAGFLQRRFPFLSIKITQSPRELGSTARQSGPPLYALYKEGVFQQNIIAGWDRFHQLGPEAQVQQGPNGGFLRESEVENSVKKWWTRELDLQKKREARIKDRDR